MFLDRETIQASTLEHRTYKDQVTRLLADNKFVSNKNENNVTIYHIDISDVNKTSRAISELISIFSSIVYLTLGVELSKVVDAINVYVLDENTVWVEIFVKNDNRTKARLYGRKYAHITALRTLLYSYSGRTGVYIAVGVNS